MDFNDLWTRLDPLNDVTGQAVSQRKTYKNTPGSVQVKLNRQHLWRNVDFHKKVFLFKHQGLR